MAPSSDFDVSFQLGYNAAPYIAGALLLFGIFTSLRVATRPRAHKMCALSLAVVCGGVLVGTLLTMRPFGVVLQKVGGLLGLFGPIGGFVLAVVGLVDYADHRHKYQRGRVLALVALIAATAHISAVLFVVNQAKKTPVAHAGTSVAEVACCSAPIEDPLGTNAMTLTWDSPQILELMSSPKKLAKEMEQLRRDASQDKPEALLKLSVMYERGIGVATNLTEAARLCRRAADMGFAPAQTHFGLLLSEGTGMSRDHAQAVKWFEKGAAHNDAHAEYLLGYCYLNGEGVETNFLRANEWFRKAAGYNSAAGLHNLAVSYVRGRAVPTNFLEAIRLFRRAGELGCARSAATAAGLLLRESSSAALSDALTLARMAADRGDPLGAMFLAEMYQLGRGVPRNLELASAWMRKAAGKGVAEADALLGTWLMDGTLGKPDYSAALPWLEQAANAGNPRAQNNLGLMYCDGMGVPVRRALAFELFQKSAAHNFDAAWINLGRMHYKGWEVPENPSEAFRCYRKAAELGVSRGEMLTGWMLFEGRGTQQDLQESARWLIKALLHGENDTIATIAFLVLERRLDSATTRAAIDALTTAAGQGSLEASATLGEIHLHGIRCGTQPYKRRKAPHVHSC